MLFKLVEMAEKKRYILQDMRSSRDKYIEHLIKLFLWRDENWSTEWKQEIYGFYKSVPKMKENKKKYPDEKDMYEAIFGGVEDVFDERLSWLVEEIETNNPELEHRKIGDLITMKAHWFISDYSHFVSNTLHQNGIVIRADAISKLNYLLSRYGL